MLLNIFLGLRKKPDYLAQADIQLEEARKKLISDRAKVVQYASFYTPEEVEEELNRIDLQIGNLTRALIDY